jgi:hypothetical protein
MSHFTVLVIGENPEDQLERYNESIETERYKKGEVSESEKEAFIEFYEKKDRANKEKTFEELYELYGEEWNGNSWALEDGEWFEFSTYNPDSKWDLYQLGGCWSGFLKVKEGVEPVIGESGTFDNKPKEGYADEATKGEIDFDFMVKEALREAQEAYDTVYPFIKDTPLNRTWEDVMADNTIGDHGEKVKFYHGQERVVAFKKAEMGWFSDVNNYNCTRDEFIRKYTICPYTTFAMVKDGKWFEKGQMGWFGTSANEMSQEEWDNIIKETVEALPDDTLISLYDCHI